MVIGDLPYWLFFPSDLNQGSLCHWRYNLISISPFIQFRHRKGPRIHILNNTEQAEGEIGKNENKGWKHPQFLGAGTQLCPGRVLGESLMWFWHVQANGLWKEVPAVAWQSEVPESAWKWGHVGSARVPLGFRNISSMLSHWKLFNLSSHPWCI